MTAHEQALRQIIDLIEAGDLEGEALAVAILRIAKAAMP